MQSLHFGDMMEDMEDRFEVGDFVFAKLKGHPHWPATISQIETHYANGTSGQERIKYNVYFYGSHQMLMLKVDSILRFQENYELFKRKYASNPKFTSALGELEAEKEQREEYVKSLQDCIEETSRFDAPQEKPDDEMFSHSDSCDEDNVTSTIAHSPTTSSGFGDGFDSDEEYQALRTQKYEILSMEKVPYLGCNDFILVISLGFREEDLLEDFKAIREEIRMMSCFVRLERLSAMPKRPRGRPGLSTLQRGRPGLSTSQRGRPPQHINRTVKVRRPRKFKVVVPSKSKPLSEEEPPDWLEEEKKKPKKRKYWRKQYTSGGRKPTLTVLAAEAVKRRRRPRKKRFRDETRLLSLRQRSDASDAVHGEGNSKGTKTCCSAENCTCGVQPPAITCPICQAQFSSSVDYKQHSFNIHIMGL